MSIPPSIGSPTILPFLSTSIVVGNAIISEAYLPAFEEESIERLRYFAPWLSRIAEASFMAVLLPLKVSVLMPTTSPPIDLIASFNSLRLDNSATQGLQPLNQKLTTVTAFFENKLSSTGLPLKSLPDKLLKGDVASVFWQASEYGIRYHGLPEGEDASFFLCKELVPGYLDEITGEYATPEGYLVDEQNAEEFDKQFS